MAENAQRDLDEALPALEEAMKVILHSCDYYFQYDIIQLQRQLNMWYIMFSSAHEKTVVILLDCLQALELLNKKDMTEIKSYGRPPALVETVMQAVMILRGCDPTWAEAKRQLGTRKRKFQIFIKSLHHTDVTHGFRHWLRHEIHTRLLYNQTHMSQTEKGEGWVIH